MGENSGTLRFGDFTLDLADRRLVRGGEPVELGSRYFDALALLACHPGQLVSKDRFMDEVWRGIPVTDEALTQAIRTLRRALGDEAAAPRFIETVPKHGYRFVAEVGTDAPPAEKRVPQSPAARIAGATTLGGLAAGLVGGIFYGALGTSGGAAGFVTILILTCALALLGGAGIGSGMALTAIWRGKKDWAVVLGGAAGGVVVGALGSVLASHGLASLTGIVPPRVTGMFEGLALGTAASLACVAAWRYDLSRTAATALALAIGAILAGATAFAGGRFYALTLSLLEGLFPASDLDVSALAQVFGEGGFFMFSILGTAMLEGAVFTAAIVLANTSWRVRSS